MDNSKLSAKGCSGAFIISDKINELVQLGGNKQTILMRE
jgi:hypothetical protein